MNAKEYLKGFYESHDEDSRLLSQSGPGGVDHHDDIC